MGPIARRQLIAWRDSSSNLNAKRTWNGSAGRTGSLRRRSGFGALEAARPRIMERFGFPFDIRVWMLDVWLMTATRQRSEEHTSELQSQSNLVCRLLLEKKKKKI